MADIEKFVLKIEVDGEKSIDSLIQSIDEVDKKVKAINGKSISITGDPKSIKALSTDLDNLGKKVKAINNQKISMKGEGLDWMVDMSNVMQDMGSSMSLMVTPANMVGTAILGMGAAAAAATINLANVSREVSNFAAAGNTDTTTFQLWAAGANTVGVQADKLSDIFKDVNDKIGEFLLTGGGEAKDFFTDIAPLVGVTAEQFRGLSGPDALQLYISTLEKAGVPTQEMITMVEALADDGSLLIPILKDQGAGMKALGERAKELGAIIDEDTLEQSKKLKTAMDELGMSVTALSNDIGSALTPAAIAIANFARDAIQNFRKLLRESATFKTNLFGALDSSYVEGQGAYDNSVTDLMVKADEEAKAIKVAEEKRMKALMGGYKSRKYSDVAKSYSPGYDKPDKPKKGGGGKSDAEKAAEKLAKEAERERDAMIKSAEKAEEMVIAMRLSTQSRMDALDLETSLLDKTKEEADQIRATAKLRKDEGDAILKLETAIKDEMAKASPNLVAVETYKTGIQDVKKATDAIVQAQDSYNKKLKETDDRLKNYKIFRADMERSVAFGEEWYMAQDQASGQLYGKELEDAKKRLEIEREIRKESDAGTFKFDPLGRNTERRKQLISTLQSKKDRGAMSDLGFTQYELDMAAEVKKRLYQLQADDELVRGSMIAGWKDSWSQIAESMTPFNTAAQAANDLWGNISSSIDTAVTTGKFKFADFRDSVIRDIAAMMAKAAASKLIGTLLGTAVNAVIPGAGNGFAIGGDKGGSAMPRASGGAVGANNSYLVGERGPELFMPGQSGTVIPNRNLTADTKPQVVNNYTYNVSAIDGQSVARFFMENKNMVAAANNSARKERS